MDHPYYTVGQVIYNNERLKKIMNQSFYDNYTNQHIFTVDNNVIKNKKILNSAIFINPVIINNEKNGIKNNFKEFLCKFKSFDKIKQILNKDYICGDIIQISLEQPPNEKNKIELTNITDKFGILKVFYIGRSQITHKNSIEESLKILGEFFIKK